jgi:glycosyltransferase involved in cell wall biosynthesis
VTSSAPLASVVIPTRNRAPVVCDAVRSALAQSLDPIEVIVVIDGPDARTETALRQIDDSRLSVITLPEHAGASGARNAGVLRARGRWVAFLDDDDEWLPGKLSLQHRVAQESRHSDPIVACRVLARTQTNEFVWPRRVPEAGEPISEYMFCRRSPFFGEGLVPTNTIFTTRELLAAGPFQTDLRDHEDLDWLLRVCGRDGVGVEFVPGEEPLTVWRLDRELIRMSSSSDWRYSLAWIRSKKELVTPRAYASFLMTWLGAAAARSKDWEAFPTLAREAFRHGRPTLVDVVSYAAYWLVPEALQRQIAGAFARIAGAFARRS